MKTSNKILISFLISLFGGITLLFVGSKYYKGYDDKDNVIFRDQKTSSFSVIVLEPKALLVVKNGSEFKVTQGYRKGVVPNFAAFEVRNDTLFMFAAKSKTERESVIYPQVYCNNIKLIIAKKESDVSLNKYQVDSVNVRLNKSKFYCDLDNPVFISLDAKDSYMNLKGDCFENINVKLDKSKIDINSKKGIKQISGTLKNDSEIFAGIDGEINLAVDKSSRLFFRN